MRKEDKYLNDLRHLRSCNFDKTEEDNIIKNEILDKLDLIEEIGITLEELGLTEEDILDDKYNHRIEDDEYSTFEVIDEFKIINLYKYTSDVYGRSDLGPKSRDFCIKLVGRSKSKLFSYLDILKITPNKGLGRGGSNIYSVFRFRGGSNCNHKWKKFKYDTITKKLIVADASEQPKQVALR